MSCEYPLINKRYIDDCAISVIINPADKKYEVEMKGTEVIETMYSLNEKTCIIDEKLIVPLLSATYIKIHRKII